MLTKHCGEKLQSVTDFIFKGRELTPPIMPVPPAEDSQPIPSVLLANEVQLTEKASPNFTTIAGGVI